MLASFRSLISRFLREDDGAALVEYALLIGLIAVVALGAVTAIGNSVNSRLNTAATAIQPQ